MSDKTYAETQGEATFDWWKALENPPEYRSPGHIQLRETAKSWVTCACGNQCAIIPRSAEDGLPNGSPLDEELADLGVEFFDNVSEALWGNARRTLKLIEARSAILIAEELAKLNAVTEDAP